MKKIIVKELKKQTNLSRKKIEEMIEIPPAFHLGNYAFPCFSLAKKGRSPEKTAKDIARKIKPIEGISKIEVSGPYINFFIDEKKLAEDVISKILTEKKKYGSGKEMKKIIIEFSSPNIGKPMHVGHIRSTILGDSLKNIFKFLGNKVVSINYLGDYGLHIGKLIVAYKLWGNAEKIKMNPEKELLNLYVKFCEKEDSFIEKNFKNFSGIQKYRNNKWTQKAIREVNKLECNNIESKKILRKIKKYSLKSIFKIYKLLDIKFDEIVGQSSFSHIGKEIIKRAVENEVAIKGKEGNIIVNLKEYNLPNKIVLRSNKSSLYSTQDIGAAVKRYKKYKFDKMIYVVGSSQKVYFQQLFKILEKFGYKWANKLVHLPFGLLYLDKEKISSRRGKVIFLKDVIDKTEELAFKQIIKENPGLKNKRNIAREIAISTLKYFILSREPGRNIEFNFSREISFEGNTGSYLQYSYARASSILKKAKRKKIRLKPDIIDLTDQENKIVRKLSKFPENLRETSKQLNPALLSNYLFELAQLFNKFYHSCPVINSNQKEFRITLVKSFKIVLGEGLRLLGIKPLEKM